MTIHKYIRHTRAGWLNSPSEHDNGGVTDNNNGGGLSTVPKKKRGRRKRDLSEDEVSRNCFSYLDPTSGMVEKTKRARTSFKHHQLRIMKSHFQMNQNPDSRELKDLASKTGLDKKVLQVRCIPDDRYRYYTIITTYLVRYLTKFHENTHFGIV